MVQRWHLGTASHFFLKKDFSLTKAVANCFPTVITVEKLFPDSYKLLRDNCNCCELLRDSYNCHELF